MNYGLDPLFWTFARLFNCDVLSLIETSDACCFRLPTTTVAKTGRFIRKVQVCGIIVSVDEKDNRIEYILDDSTSHLGIVFWLNYNDQHSSLSSSKLLLHNHPSRRRIRLGDAVRISGKVSKYKHTIKVTAYDIDILLDPNEEVLHWLQVMHLHQEYYSLPFDQLDNAEWINQIVEAVGDRGDALHLTTGSNNNNSAEAAGMSLRDTSSDKLQRRITDFYNNQTATSADLTEILKDHMVLEKRVAFKSIVQGTHWINMVNHLYKIRDRPIPSPTGLINFYSKIFHSLTNTGLIYLEDEENDVYEIISHKQNLGACILRIIAKSASAATINNTTSSSSTATTGISFDVLRLQVRSKSKFKHVTKETIALSIRMLIENSDVFEPSKNRYLPL